MLFRGSLCILAGWKRGKQGWNYSLAHILVVDAKFFSSSLSCGEEGKTRAMLYEPDVTDCLCRRKLTSLFGSVW